MYQYIPPSKQNVLSSKNVSVNFGGVTVKEQADVHMLMNASAFAARSLQF